jgi:hypothetical protein
MIVTSGWARTALSHHICTGIPRRRLGKLVAELAGPWVAGQESRLRERRGHDRQRAAGAGPDHELVFTDRVVVTLVILRFQLPHAALALFHGVDRSTITRAVHEVRPLLAARGFAVPTRPDVRLRTLADVFAYAAAEGVELRIDGTEVRVRRPRANKPGRRAFISGKMRQNTKKATVVTDEKGRTLWAGAFRPGRQHDQTALKTEGICDLFERFPQVKAKVDAGYRGLAKQFPHQVQAPPLKPKKDAPPEDLAAWEEARTKQSSERICVEHANAEHKQWRPLQRWIGRREYFDQTYQAIASLVSDRAAMSSVHREVAGHGSGVCGVLDARAGGRRMTSVKIVGHRETSRFVRTSRALTRVVAHFGSVRTLPRTRQFLRWAKPCSTGARTAASALLDSFCPRVRGRLRAAL